MNIETHSDQTNAFRQALREAGYSEGRDISNVEMLLVLYDAILIRAGEVIK